MRIRNLIAVAGVTVGIFGGTAAPAQADVVVGACAEYETPETCQEPPCTISPEIGITSTNGGETFTATGCVDSGL